MLNASQVPTLVNTDHKLLNHAVAFSKKYFCGQISISEVKVELKNQIEKVLDNGIRISHIDSHQHVHILPRIFQVVTELAEQYKIKYIRIPNEKFQAYMFSNLSLIPRVVQLKAINYLCSNLNTISSKKNDFFYGFYFGGQLNKKNLIIILKKLPQYGLGELMCHPGNSAEAANLSKIDYRKENELAALTDEEVKAVIVSKQIRLTSFKEMADVHE
ncbi:MAG: ChbG/HpnK family deacetylase [Ignavibacteriaceae bacterium]|nr:ChbG/HpnK family deacetylase [Ignavibacteriaceae bacterium]